MSETDELAALRRKVEELEAKVSPPKSDFVPQTPEQWRDEMRALSERRMDFATPPSVIQDWAVLPDHIVKGIVHDNRAPTGPSGAIPSSQQVSNVRGTNVAGSGTGWVREIPLSNPPGTHLVDALCIADDVRQRAEKK